LHVAGPAFLNVAAAAAAPIAVLETQPAGVQIREFSQDGFQRVLAALREKCGVISPASMEARSLSRFRRLHYCSAHS
jgi:hypothetical protein